MTLLSMDPKGTISPVAFKRGCYQDMSLGVNLNPGTYLIQVTRLLNLD